MQVACPGLVGSSEGQILGSFDEGPRRSLLKPNIYSLQLPYDPLIKPCISHPHMHLGSRRQEIESGSWLGQKGLVSQLAHIWSSIPIPAVQLTAAVPYVATDDRLCTRLAMCFTAAENTCVT